MRFIISIMLILSVLALFCSCSTKSGEIKAKEIAHPTKQVRAMWIVTTDLKDVVVVDSTVVLIAVDSLYRVGDIIARGDIKYRIID